MAGADARGYRRQHPQDPYRNRGEPEEGEAASGQEQFILSVESIFKLGRTLRFADIFFFYTQRRAVIGRVFGLGRLTNRGKPTQLFEKATTRSI